MTLPWVSRSVHEAVCAAKVAEIAVLRRAWDNDIQYNHRLIAEHATTVAAMQRKMDDLQADLDAERHQRQTLLAELTTAKSREAPPPRERSVIADVIRAQAAGNAQLALYLKKRSRIVRAEHPHWTDAQIATELSRWETAEEMPPEFLIGGETPIPT